jgi:alpha-ribazole phosphatase
VYRWFSIDAIGEYMPRLLLVRHGDTDFNQRRRFMGYTDIEMSSFGKKQVERLKDYLGGEDIHAVFSSDLQRTMRTAEILSTGRHLAITPCPELRELNYGECEGLSFGEIGDRYPEVAAKCVDFNLDLQFPGGEDYRSLIKRERFFVKRLQKFTRNETVLVVSHSGPLKVLLCHFLGLPMKYSQRLHIDTASLSVIYNNVDYPLLTKLNETSYLKDLKI